MEKKMFYRMLRIRRVEEAVANEYQKQEMRCPVHLSIGQEAVSVGVCDLLREADYLVSNHRGHSHYLAKGGNLKSLIAEFYGKVSGCAKGIGGSMHLTDHRAGVVCTTPIVGGSMPVGVGVAFKTALKQESAVTAIFFGEGATEEGVWAECLNFASLKKLPILFVCENNLYSVYSPLSVRQSDMRSRIKIAEAHGIFSLHGDGNDVFDVREKTQKALRSLKEEKGPVFVEFDTYRFLEHCGPNDDTALGYRTKEEVDVWKKKDPIACCASLFDSATVQNMEAVIKEEIAEAFEYAKASTYPSRKDTLTTLYAP